jgi:hypothetical protein
MILGLSSLVFDVEVAFLNAKMDFDNYMSTPKGVEAAGDECILLLKALYGSLQASRLWGIHYANIMKKIGFHQSKSDPCLFVRQNEKGLVMVVIYIDDGYAAGDKAALDQMIEQLKAEELKLKVEYSMQDYLSCQVLFSKDGSTAWLGQPHMIKKIVKTFEDDVKGLKKCKTPGTPGFTVVRPKGEDPVVSEDMQARYRSSVGMLLHLGYLVEKNECILEDYSLQTNGAQLLFCTLLTRSVRAFGSTTDSTIRVDSSSPSRTQLISILMFRCPTCALGESSHID